MFDTNQRPATQVLGKLERHIDFPDWILGILSHPLINTDVYQCLKTEKEVQIKQIMLEAWKARQIKDIELINNMVESITGKKPAAVCPEKLRDEAIQELNRVRARTALYETGKRYLAQELFSEDSKTIAPALLVELRSKMGAFVASSYLESRLKDGEVVTVDEALEGQPLLDVCVLLGDVLTPFKALTVMCIGLNTNVNLMKNKKEVFYNVQSSENKKKNKTPAVLRKGETILLNVQEKCIIDKNYTSYFPYPRPPRSTTPCDTMFLSELQPIVVVNPTDETTTLPGDKVTTCEAIVDPLDNNNSYSSTCKDVEETADACSLNCSPHFWADDFVLHPCPMTDRVHTPTATATICEPAVNGTLCPTKLSSGITSQLLVEDVALKAVHLKNKSRSGNFLRLFIPDRGRSDCQCVESIKEKIKLIIESFVPDRGRFNIVKDALIMETALQFLDRMFLMLISSNYTDKTTDDDSSSLRGVLGIYFNPTIINAWLLH